MNREELEHHISHIASTNADRDTLLEHYYDDYLGYTSSMSTNELVTFALDIGIPPSELIEDFGVAPPDIYPEKD